MKSKIILSLCVYILLLSGCSKENEGDTPLPVALQTQNEFYAPFEIVTIVAGQPIFISEAIPAKINDIDVILQPGQSTAAFLLPSLQNNTSIRHDLLSFRLLRILTDKA